MVNDAGQLYTMEGIAAGLIMILTAYIVISTTSIYTTGDTHIPDMQLEQLGSDVLAMMDTPDNISGKNQLVEFVHGNKGDDFKETFLKYCNTTATDTDDLHMSASVTYRIRGDENTIKEHPFVGPDETWTGRESAVRVTRWVHLNRNQNPDWLGSYGPNEKRHRAVLVEVLLWRA